jgi:mRNA interferase MazF
MRQREIWLVNLDPTIGSEIRKTRPCVIVGDDAIGILPLKLVAPITDLKERYRQVPWMVVLTPDTVNNLVKPSALDLFQVRCLSEERLVRKIGEITSLELAQVQVALKTVLGIP